LNGSKFRRANSHAGKNAAGGRKHDQIVKFKSFVSHQLDTYLPPGTDNDSLRLADARAGFLAAKKILHHARPCALRRKRSATRSTVEHSLAERLQPVAT
jgi:hypothetical protein